MTRRHVPLSAGALVALFLTWAGAGAQAQAQTTAPAAGPKPGEVEMAPIDCWWRADRSAIRIGERFTLVLTCGVVETGTTTVVPNVNQLEAGALSITPFEAVSGVRSADVLVPPRRFFQFEYSVRLLGDGFFGKDVEVPPLRITYNIQAPGGATQGRDRTYVMPSLPIRVLAIVPESANDIRDSSGLTFSGVDSRRFRATVAQAAGVLCFVFAGVVVLMGAVGAVRERRVAAGPRVTQASSASVLGGCLRTLVEVKDEAGRGGWTPELARRALGALRIGGAHALGKPVAQQFVEAGVAPREGQVALTTGWIRRRRALASAATTPAVIGKAIEKGPADRGASQRATLQQLADALDAFSKASYGRAAACDGAALDAALDQAVDAIGGLRRGARWPMNQIAAARSLVGA